MDAGELTAAGKFAFEGFGGHDLGLASGAWSIVSPLSIEPPNNALIPTSPSSPTVAISTIEPFFITVVIDATPPLRKNTSLSVR